MIESLRNEIEMQWLEKLCQNWNLYVCRHWNEGGFIISKCPRGQYIHGTGNVNACPQGIDTWSKLLKILST